MEKVNYTVHISGVAIDSNNLVYISENGNQRISVYTSKGQFVASTEGRFEQLWTGVCL